ncbi:MAG: hypothetical protein ACFNYA_03555 [Capnocytophaga granulosa]
MNVFGVAHLKKQLLLIMDMPNYSLIISLFLFDILVIIDVMEDPHIWSLQASLWGI